MANNHKNSLWLFIQYIIVLLVSLISLKINILNYGPELFGIFIIINSILILGIAFDLGIGTSIVKYVAELNHSDESGDELNALVSTGLILFLAIGLIYVTVLYSIKNILIYSRNLIPVHYKEEADFIFLLLCFAFYFNFISIYFKSIFEGLNNFITPSIVIISQNALLLIIVALCYLFKLDIKIFSILFSLNYLVTISAYIILFIKKTKKIKISPLLFKYSLIKRIAKFSFSVQMISLFSALIDPTIKFMIGNFYNVGYVSFYEIGKRFAMAISGLFFTTFRNLLPITSILKTKEDYSQFLYSDGIKFTRLGLTYSGLVFGILSFFILVFMKISFGYDKALLIFMILSMSEIINNMGYTLYIFLIGIGKAFFISSVQFINIVITSLILYFSFLYTHSLLGLLGYSSSVFIVNILMLYYLKHIMEFSILNWFKEIKIFKLFFLLSATLIVIIVLYKEMISFYYPMLGLMILSILVFQKDIRENILYLINIFELKRKRNDG